MITYCLNSLTISTDEVTENLPASLYEDMGSITYSNLRWIDFNNLITAPPETLDMSAWNIKNWGTYGLSSGGRIEETLEDSFVICLETYETPPLPWIKVISSLYPELVFDLEYLNIKNNFAGHSSYIAGVEVENDNSEADIAAWEKFGYLESDFTLFTKYARGGGNA